MEVYKCVVTRLCCLFSLPALLRSGSISCRSSPHWMSCTSCPNTLAALRASLMMTDADRHMCGHARGVLGTHTHINVLSTLKPVYAKITYLSSFFCFILILSFSLDSPGRSPSCYDNEIVMMNHVYKERFPKVSKTQTHTRLISDY